MTEELVELLWVVEGTIEAQPELNAVLADIVASPLFAAADLPQPSPRERLPPVVEVNDDSQTEFDLE